MPSATITLVGTKPTPAQKRALFERTTDLMVEVLRRPRNLIVVSLAHGEFEDWSVAGALLREGERMGAQVVFRILEGQNSKREIADMVAAMTAMVGEVWAKMPCRPM